MQACSNAAVPFVVVCLVLVPQARGWALSIHNKPTQQQVSTKEIVDLKYRGADIFLFA